MPETNDFDLLREYSGSGSESAFAQIVHRHVNLVYSVALRFTGNGEDAQDVAQTVFVILARKAASLRPKTIITGWLYETTRFTAMNFLMNKNRRQAREQEAYMQSASSDAATEGIWHQLAPLLEEAMTRLSEKDRTLIALRFFENKSIAETAVLVGINEWAARKRVDRTMERLREYFSRRGITMTAQMIAGAISANSVQAAPTMLARAATSVALAKSATTSIPTSTLVKGSLKIMAWSKAKTAIVIGAVVFLATGTTTLMIVKAHSGANQSNSMTGDSQRNSMVAEMAVMKESVFQAVVLFAKEHQDEIPKSMADLKPYLPANASGMDDDHWQISATGNMTPLLTRGDVVLVEQKDVPPSQKKIILYTDGHIARK